MDPAVHAFLDPNSSFPLPQRFTFREYLATEREFWALFPETQGKRVNFCQIGLTAQLYVEVEESGKKLDHSEAYFLMPCSDQRMRPVRMRALRHLTVMEYRMSRLTALKLGALLRDASRILERVHQEVLGTHVIEEEGRFS
jgi:hypothetical protein